MLDRPGQWSDLMALPAARADLLRIGATPALVARHARWGRPVYLASPYTLRAADEAGRWDADRSEAALRDAAWESVRLLEVGVTAVSPIVMSAAMIRATHRSRRRLDPFDGPLWHQWCRPLLDACAAIVVPDIPGWRQSCGVWREVCMGLDLQMPIFIYSPIASEVST